MIYKTVHFTGAGGVGMAGLAHLALDLGCRVSGSDLVDSDMLETLRRRGVPVRVGHWDALPGPPELLVYSSAVPETDPERRLATGIPQMRRGDFLSHLALHFPVRVAVSGSHGKTSTSAMLTHILKECGLRPGYLVGGHVNGWERSGFAGDGSILVSEVDESDGTQAGFPATLAMVLNIDDDHSWALGGTRALERCFLALCLGAGHVIAWRSDTTARLFGAWRKSELLDTPLPASSELPLRGWHSRIDAAMAVAAAVHLGLPRQRALEALRTFPGVARRMSERAKSPDGSLVLIEDYAHHPAELEATLDAIHEAYPTHAIIAVFQPHRIERVLRYGERFARLLSRLPWSCVVTPFAAWRTDGRTADVRTAIADRVTTECICLPNTPEAIVPAATAAWRARCPAVLAVIGAGDIGGIIPDLEKIVLGREPRDEIVVCKKVFFPD